MFSNCREFELILRHSPYAVEINKYLKDKEDDRKPFLCRSPQLQYRDKLIENMRSICIKLKLSAVTLHLAVYLLDTFMDNYIIIVERLNSVALACISLSAKFEQQEGSFPKISQLTSFEKNKYPNKDFVKLELKILQFFNWNLAQPTVAHFVEYYRWMVVFNWDCSDRESTRSLKKQAFLTISEFMGVTLNDYRINKFEPSLVAACCVLASRKCLKLTPQWPNILAFITGYNESNLDFCCSFLMSLYYKYFASSGGADESSDSDNNDTINANDDDDDDNNDNEPNDSVDLGYHSRSSSNPNSPEEMRN